MLEKMTTLMSTLKKSGRRGLKAEKPTIQNLQKIGTNMLHPSWVGTRVKYLAYYDIDEEENERKLRPVGGKY